MFLIFYNIILCVFIIFIDLNLIFILVFTVFILYFFYQTYAESKTLGSNLVGLNDRFMKFIDKILNDKTQFMLSMKLSNQL